MFFTDEMTKNCRECPCSDGEYGVCNIDYSVILSADERPKECPLQEVTKCRDCVFATYVHDSLTDKFTIFRCERMSKLLDDENSFCSWAIKKKARPIRKEEEE